MTLLVLIKPHCQLIHYMLLRVNEPEHTVQFLAQEIIKIR